MRALCNSTLLMLGASLSQVACAADASILKPPPGAKVAIVVFEDLQGPECARAYPLVWQAGVAREVPVVLHDFPLPMHNWSFESAVWARFFDTTSEKLGNLFRAYVYANQTKITLANLQKFVVRFGHENKVPIPALPDSSGMLAEKVRADYALGQRIGLVRAPTIFVVGHAGVSSPFVETVNSDELGQAIDDLLKNSGSDAPPKKPASKKMR